MYDAKKQGKGIYSFYNADTHETSAKLLEMESLLHAALENNELELHYQPIVDVDANTIVAAEALLRWNNPELGTIPPLDFIPLAESNGMIIPIGQYVLYEACRQMKQWQENGLSIARVSVNVSARQLEKKDFVATVNQVLIETGLAPEYLCLEITEGLLISDLDAAIEILNELRQLGVYLSLDDFGTGYSSLSYLKRLPIHNLKIDRSFIRDIATNPDDVALANAIISMSNALSLNTIVEGVETIEQVNVLSRNRNLYIQGYHYSPPLAADAFSKMLAVGLETNIPVLEAAY